MSGSRGTSPSLWMKLPSNANPCNHCNPGPINRFTLADHGLNTPNGEKLPEAYPAWHLECSELKGHCAMKTARIKNLTSKASFPWVNFLLLTSLGVVTGLVLALTISIPVS